MKNEGEKPSYQSCWTSSGRSQSPCLIYSTLTSLWLIIRGKVSNMFRHSYLSSSFRTSLLPAAAFMALFSRAVNVQHRHCLDVRISVFWHNLQIPEWRELDVLLYLRLCSMSLSQQNHVPFENKTKKQSTRWKGGICILHTLHTFQNQWTNWTAV